MSPTFQRGQGAPSQGIKERLIASHVPDGGIERAATFHTAHHRSAAAGLSEKRSALGNEENEKEDVQRR
ncbi:hypothetical protein MRX96_016328 [Rhipicephalus microplus]